MQSVVKMMEVIKVIMTARERRIKINVLFPFETERGLRWQKVADIQKRHEALFDGRVIEINYRSFRGCGDVVKLDLFGDKII